MTTYSLNGRYVPPEIAMFGKKYATKWLNNVNNMRTYQNWYNRFINAAISCFAWEGLPEGIDQRFLETALFFRGCIALFHRNDYNYPVDDFVVAPATPSGNLDIYLNPNRIICISPNGQSWNRHAGKIVRKYGEDVKGVEEPDAVVCFESYDRTPMFPIIDSYCQQIATIDNVFMQHTNAQRFPYFIEVPEEGKKNAEVMFAKINRGEPAIYLNNGTFQNMGLQVLNNQVPYIGDKLISDKRALIAECYTAMGIDNSPTDKRTQVFSAEVLQNNEQVALQRISRLKARQDFAERANELFGLDISVRWSIEHFPIDELGINSATEIAEMKAQNDYQMYKDSEV